MAKIETCHFCIYAHFDLNLWARTLWSGLPLRPTCANRPGSLGVMREVSGGVCRNYREKPAEPDAQAKQIILTNGMTAYVDAADYEEISRYTWQLVSGGYAGRRENRKLVLMHRQIMNPPEGMQVDHLKGNRLDNTRARLQICTPGENSQNRAKRADDASRHIGVSRYSKRQKWAAKLPWNGRQKFLGYFDDEEEAARAYDHAAVLYLGDFARLNFPEEWPPERRAEVRATRDTADRKGEKVGTPEAQGPAAAQPRATRAERRATKSDSDAKRTTRDAKRKTKPRRAAPPKGSAPGRQP